MKDRKPVPTSMLGIASKAPSDQKITLVFAAEASIHEEPGAGKPHAGICAGCALKACEVQLPEMMTVVKLSQQPRIESCVVDR